MDETIECYMCGLCGAQCVTCAHIVLHVQCDMCYMCGIGCHMYYIIMNTLV